MFASYILFNVGANPLVAQSLAKGESYCKYQAAAKLTCFGQNPCLIDKRLPLSRLRTFVVRPFPRIAVLADRLLIVPAYLLLLIKLLPQRAGCDAFGQRCCWRTASNSTIATAVARFRLRVPCIGMLMQRS